MPVSGAMSRSCPNGQSGDSATASATAITTPMPTATAASSPTTSARCAMGQADGPERELGTRPPAHET